MGANLLLNKLIMRNQLIASHIDALQKRALSNGGFAARISGKYRIDATAWAVLALAAADGKADLIDRARARLMADQLTDGRISLSPERPEAFWPTPLVILAWHGSPAYREPGSQAIDFLIKTTGRHFPRQPAAPIAHNTAIKGWPWTANTHSWVEPTALSVIALHVAGYGEHERTREATRMLMDRQLPRGGWNVGSTIVFGQELRPMPETTGVALDALAGRVSRKDVERSLGYLKSQGENLRTPFSLGWSVLGLGAWGERPNRAQEWIFESLKQQEKYGIYDTTLLSLLLVAFFAPGGVESILE
jgi:hypothetical protein